MDTHTLILDTYYWPFIDRGKLHGQTPLIHHQLGLRNLTYRIASLLGVSELEAERALQLAIAEVDI